MNSYRVELKRSAEKSLSKLPNSVKKSVSQLIDELAENPYMNGHKKLVGSEHTYRIRSGDYRIIYSVFDSLLIVYIIKIGHRKDIYK